MNYCFTRTAIYNEYRWYCLYINSKSKFTSILHVPTATLYTTATYLSFYQLTFTTISTAIKIKRWEI